MQPAHHARQHAPADIAHRHAEAHLLHQHQQKCAHAGFFRLHGERNQRRDQENRHRVIRARLNLKRGLHPLIQAHAAVAQQAEHRPRIGGADNGRHQNAEAPIQPHIKSGKCTQKRHGGNHAPAGQHRRRLERDAEALHAGAQAAVEQNHRQGELAD